jgi:hypothetical protein
MRKIRNPEKYGADGERWITRRELEHMGCKRAWGGKYSEDQVDVALAALEFWTIIERRKIYDPVKRTSKISIRICPENILAMLSARKEYALVGNHVSLAMRGATFVSAQLKDDEPLGADVAAATQNDREQQTAGDGGMIFIFEHEMISAQSATGAVERGVRRQHRAIAKVAEAFAGMTLAGVAPDDRLK